MRAAFTPFAANLVALGCQSPASVPHLPGSENAAPLATLRGADPCSSHAALTDSTPGVPAGAGAAPVAAQQAGLPVRLGEYCLDPLAALRSYAAGGRCCSAAEPIGTFSLERACERVLGPSCVGDEGARLERVVAARYAHQSGAARELDVVLSRFRDGASAYAHFTRALIGDADPAALEVSSLDGGSLVLQGEDLLAWRGRHVLWLRFFDELPTAEQRRDGAARGLPPLARGLLDGLGEVAALPAAVQRLPAHQRVPLGVRLLLDGAFGVPGLGTSARGYYQDGKKRWRVVAIPSPDAESARDVMSTLERQPGAVPVQNAPIQASRLIERRSGAEPDVTWLVGRRDDVVYGIGDEAAVLPEHLPAREEAAVKLSLQEKMVKLLEANVR